MGMRILKTKEIESTHPFTIDATHSDPHMLHCSPDLAATSDDADSLVDITECTIPNNKRSSGKYACGLI